MKKFFYACAAVLCLALTFHFGATNAQGQNANTVIQMGNEAALLADGEIWVLNPGEGWTSTGTSVPIPASSVAFFPSRDRFVDTSNNGWGIVSGTWVNYGPPGGGATLTVRHTLGQLKAKYR